MQNLKNIFQEMAPVLEPCDPPHEIIQKLQESQVVTDDEAGAFLDWLIYETRQAHVKRLTSFFNETHDPQWKPDLAENVTRGLCGFSQCVTGYALQDMGLTPHAFVTHSLPLFYHGHAGLTLEIKTTKGDNMFLLDPTFRQFCDPVCVRDRYGEIDPGYKIGATSEGLKFLEHLLTKGYAKLTPALAKSYLRSFLSEGEKIEPLESAALQFLKNPPLHEHNYYLSREELSEIYSIDR